MNTEVPSDYVGHNTKRITSLLLKIIRQGEGAPARFGLPAGAVHLHEANLIVAGTPCDAPFFHEPMHAAAAATGADVIVVHHGLCPEILNAVSFSVVVHVSRRPILLQDMLLYWHPEDGDWLVPSKIGPFIAIEAEGLRLAFDPPFITYAERTDGVCAGAAAIVRATQFAGAF